MCSLHAYISKMYQLRLLVCCKTVKNAEVRQLRMSKHRFISKWDVGRKYHFAANDNTFDVDQISIFATFNNFQKETDKLNLMEKS